MTVRYLMARWAFWRAARRLPNRPRRRLALVEHFTFTMLAATVIMFVILVATC